MQNLPIWPVKNDYRVIKEDEAIESGEYQLDSRYTSIPVEWHFCGSQAFLSVRNTGSGYIHQMAFSYNDGKIAVRRRSGGDTHPPYIWSQWELI